METSNNAPPTPRRDSSSPRASRRSSTVRIRPQTHRSNSSLRHLPAPKTPKGPGSDEQSLTSFPSLSPSVENSPNNNILERPTPKAEVRKDGPTRAVPPALAGLFSPSAGLVGEPGLFDDTIRDMKDVPGTLHHQSDAHVKHLIAKTGAVKLVKQLAQDLAQRDAEITLLQRRAEERETLLRKMLRECEVSNMDIETRLGELRKSRTRNDTGFGGELRRANDEGIRAEASITDRLSEAFKDNLHVGSDSNGQQQDATMTARRRQAPRLPSDAASTASVDSAATTKSGTTRGWKGLFGYGTGETVKATRASSLNATQERRSGSAEIQSKTIRGNRKGVAAPPDASESRDRAASGTGSTTSSQSMASWALRMVTGTQATSGQAQSRSRASTVAASDSDASKTWKAPGLQRTKSRPNVPTASHNRNGSLSGATGLARKAIPDVRTSVTNMIGPTSPGTSMASAANIGPVEMDAIVPDEKLPPTLMQYNYYREPELLIDRFGFIYDQRRRRRQNEAAAALPRVVEHGLMHHRSISSLVQPAGDTASINSHLSTTSAAPRPDTPASQEAGEAPTKRWQDYLSLSVFGSELLSHTPAAAPITEVATEEHPSTVPDHPAPGTLTRKRSSLPLVSAVSAPSAPEVSTVNAELAPPSAQVSRPSSSHGDPTEAMRELLDQINAVHDTLQRQKTVKWNDFLRKVRAEQKRDRDQNIASGRAKAQSMPENQLLDGEVIGVAGLGVKGKVGRAKGSEFRNLVLGGIPMTYRAKIWAECCGAATLRVPGYYEELVNSDFDDDTIATQIQMDITRTMTDNIFFRKGQGIPKLNEVLLAYARRNPDVGYCQGMNMITANLLLVLPTAEDAFWMLASLIENIMPSKYYDSSLLASRADQVVLRQYVSEVLPQLSSHFDSLGIDLEAVTFQWFLSIFTDCLSAEALFRVWDVVFCLNDGNTFLFQVALALLKLNEDKLLACDSPAEVYDYINQKMTESAVSIDGLIRASEGLKKEIRREDVAERREAAVQQELELVKQREDIRKGKRRAQPDDDIDTTAKSNPVGLAQAPRASDTSLHDSGIESTMKTRAGRLTRQSSRVSFGLSTKDEEDLDLMNQSWGHGDLARMTPMPIDEEFQWRA